MTVKEIGGWVLGGVLAAALLLGLTWAFQGNDFFLYRAFAPRYEAVRRETFEQSKAYRQGAVQELQAMRFDYVKAEPAHKTALASVILHRAADLDESAMPADLRAFIRGLKEGEKR